MYLEILLWGKGESLLSLALFPAPQLLSTFVVSSFFFSRGSRLSGSLFAGHVGCSKSWQWF